MEKKNRDTKKTEKKEGWTEIANSVCAVEYLAGRGSSVTAGPRGGRGGALWGP